MLYPRRIKMADNKQIDLLNFESALAELESIVGKLEYGQLTLDESLELYRKGELLSERCKDLLNNAELQVGLQEDDEDQD